MGCSPIWRIRVRNSSTTSGGEGGLLEQAADALVLLVDGVAVPVLVRVEAVEVVPVDEVGEHPRADVPGVGHGDVLLELRVALA